MSSRRVFREELQPEGKSSLISTSYFIIQFQFGVAACDASRKYLKHCLKCEKPDCPICAPLRIIWPEGDEDVESFKEHLEAFSEFIL